MQSSETSSQVQSPSSKSQFVKSPSQSSKPVYSQPELDKSQNSKSPSQPSKVVKSSSRSSLFQSPSTSDDAFGSKTQKPKQFRNEAERMRSYYGDRFFIKDSEGRLSCFFDACPAKVVSNFTRHILRHEHNGDFVDPKKFPNGAPPQYVPSSILISPPPKPATPRQPVIQSVIPSSRLKKLTLQDCKFLMDYLLRCDNVWPFTKHVEADKFGFTDYFEVIKKPMNLIIIKNKLERGEYDKPSQFVDDIRLVWNNTFLYYTKGSQIHEFAKKLSDEFESKIRSIEDGTYLPPKKKMKESDYCGKCGEGGELLICDGDCFRAFHLSCVKLKKMPKSEKWYCKECRGKKKTFLNPPPSLLPSLGNSGGSSLASNPNALSYPTYSPVPPNRPPKTSAKVPWLNFRNDKSNTPFDSELLQKAHSKNNKHYFNHLDLDLSHEDKVKRRRVDELLINTHMVYDEFFCMWRPKEKKKYFYAAKDLLEQMKQMEEEEREQFQLLKCHICELTTDQYNFIVCDRCYEEFHLNCLNETSIEMTEEWVCPFCSTQVQQKRLEENLENYSLSFEDENDPMLTTVIENGKEETERTKTWIF